MTEKIKLSFTDFQGVQSFFDNAKLEAKEFRALRRLNNQIKVQHGKIADDERAEIERLGGKINEEDGTINWGKNAKDGKAGFQKFKENLFKSKYGFSEEYDGQFDTLRALLDNYPNEITTELRAGFGALDDALNA